MNYFVQSSLIKYYIPLLNDSGHTLKKETQRYASCHMEAAHCSHSEPYPPLCGGIWAGITIISNNVVKSYERKR